MANSVYVIRLWRCRPYSSSSVYSDSGYIIVVIPCCSFVEFNDDLTALQLDITLLVCLFTSLNFSVF